jgi:hypothetical protein
MRVAGDDDLVARLGQIQGVRVVRLGLGKIQVVHEFDQGFLAGEIQQ